MRLTPLDIRKQEFKKVMRGLDQEEVEAFLSMIADEFEILIREKNQLNDDVLKLRTQLRDYQHVEQTLRETLVSARQSVEESKANSQKQAEMILREADLRSEQILEDAKEKLMELRNEIRLLKSQKDSFTKRLRYLLESQLELLEALDMDEPEIDELQGSSRAKTRGRLARMQSHQEKATERSATQNQREPRIGPAKNDLGSDASSSKDKHKVNLIDDEVDSSESDDEEPQQHKQQNQQISNQFIL